MLEVGAIVDGKITGIMNFGAFVSLPDGKSGMVHISEVSSTFVKDINEHLKEGQEVKVKVISINEDGKINLSIKKAEEQPQRKEFNKAPRRERPSHANVWQGQPKQEKEEMSFEDMMARFKQVSDEKMTDLKRNSDAKHGGGYSRRGSGRG